MLSNIKKKIFSEPFNKNYDNLKYDSEGLWSITHHKDADLITQKILEYSNINSSIVDTTSGCGGNLISFSKYFNNITGIELCINRFNIMKNNLNQYTNKKINLINDDCLNYIYDNNYDIYFFDPPWGGPNYKKETNLDLYLSNKNIIDIIKKIEKNKLIILKIPYNYNINKISKYFNLLDKLELGNMIILIFKS